MMKHPHMSILFSILTQSRRILDITFSSNCQPGLMFLENVPYFITP
jgi:hypothetical protein